MSGRFGFHRPSCLVRQLLRTVKNLSTRLTVLEGSQSRVHGSVHSTCWTCGAYDHYRSDCPLLQKTDKVEESRREGTIKWFNLKKGYGFIESEESDKDIFIHSSEIKSSRRNFRSFRKGERVTYSLSSSPKGACNRALNVYPKSTVSKRQVGRRLLQCQEKKQTSLIPSPSREKSCSEKPPVRADLGLSTSRCSNMQDGPIDAISSSVVPRDSVSAVAISKGVEMKRPVSAVAVTEEPDSLVMCRHDGSACDEADQHGTSDALHCRPTDCQEEEKIEEHWFARALISISGILPGPRSNHTGQIESV